MRWNHLVVEPCWAAPSRVAMLPESSSRIPWLINKLAGGPTIFLAHYFSHFSLAFRTTFHAPRPSKSIDYGWFLLRQWLEWQAKKQTEMSKPPTKNILTRFWKLTKSKLSGKFQCMLKLRCCDVTYKLS